MSRSGKISVAFSTHELSQVRRLVEAGEFGSSAAVVREAVRAWLRLRPLHGGAHGARRLGRSLEARRSPVEPCERVELMFDAHDAKA
ncbi:MAG: ribbon-helix-helix domain-containing protein [Caulobacteraceae bacterium]